MMPVLMKALPPSRALRQCQPVKEGGHGHLQQHGGNPVGQGHAPLPHIVEESSHQEVPVHSALPDEMAVHLKAVAEGGPAHIAKKAQLLRAQEGLYLGPFLRTHVDCEGAGELLDPVSHAPESHRKGFPTSTLVARPSPGLKMLQRMPVRKKTSKATMVRRAMEPYCS